jgi:hypothetical protein
LCGEAEYTRGGESGVYFPMFPKYRVMPELKSQGIGRPEMMKRHNLMNLGHEDQEYVFC